MKRTIIALLLVAALAAAAAADQVVVPPGYALSEISFAGMLGGFDIAPNGNFIVLDSQDLYEVTPAGSFVRKLYTFPGSVFGSFVRVDAASGKVYFGESGGGQIKSVNLDGTNPTDVATLRFNYDFAVNSVGQMFVVAGPAVYLLGPSEPDMIVSASGASGPLALDADGRLYYGTASSTWGEVGGQTIARWSAAEVAGAIGDGVLTIADGERLLENIDGPAGLALDPSGLYFTTSIQSPATVWRYAGGGANVFTISTTGLFVSWITTVRTNPANGAVSVMVGRSVGPAIFTVISTLTPVPEPASLVMLALGLGGAFLRRRR